MPCHHTKINIYLYELFEQVWEIVSKFLCSIRKYWLRFYKNLCWCWSVHKYWKIFLFIILCLLGKLLNIVCFYSGWLCSVSKYYLTDVALHNTICLTKCIKRYHPDFWHIIYFRSFYLLLLFFSVDILNMFSEFSSI